MRTLIRVPMSIPGKDFTVSRDEYTFSRESWDKIVKPVIDTINSHPEIDRKPIARVKFLDSPGENFLDDDITSLFGWITRVDLLKWECEIELSTKFTEISQYLNFESGDWFVGYFVSGKYGQNNTCEISSFHCFTLTSGRLSRKGFAINRKDKR